MTIMLDVTDPRANGEKIRRILESQEGSALLYRRITAGPSGQTREKVICSVSYTWTSAYELRIRTVDGEFPGTTVGYVGRVAGERATWTVWETDEDSGRTALRGWSDSVAVAADVLIHGEAVALRNHDARRTSGARWIRYDGYRSVFAD